MNVAFLDFWYDFQPDNNFFIHLLREIRSDVKVTEPEIADVIIYTCFGQRNKQYNHCKKIYFTGENLRPNFNECNNSITFDFDDYNGRNIRLPLWYLYIDWFNVKSYGNPNWLIPTNYLIGENEFTMKPKNKFCCTVFSSPYDTRFNMINNLNLYKKVDCYGKIHPNRIPEGERSKMDIISDYKFNICFENSIYPGYFTEKLLHAKIAGSIPIYYSDKSFDKDFNINCCVNLISFNNMSDVLEEVKKIDADDNLYNKIKSEPLFDKLPELDYIKNEMNKIL